MGGGGGGGDIGNVAISLTKLTHWLLRDVNLFRECVFLYSIYELMSWALPVKLVLGECHSAL